MTILINLFGGPGSGKSTTAAGLYYQMKREGIPVEIAREYAKDVVWEGREHLFEDQLYIFAKQRKRIRDLLGKVDFIVCDSPLLLSAMYGTGLGITFSRFVQEEHRLLPNWNYKLERDKPYQTYGRMQTEDQAKALDVVITGLLVNEPHTPIKSTFAVETIMKEVRRGRD
jgi:hypothetical protein